MWEDEYNKKGGKLTLKLNKGYTTIIWEELILGIIGNILPNEISEGINGIVFSSKKESNILQIWFRDYNKNYYAELEQCIRDLIQIPNEVPIDIKKFFYEDFCRLILLLIPFDSSLLIVFFLSLIFLPFFFLSFF